MHLGSQGDSNHAAELVNTSLQLFQGLHVSVEMQLLCHGMGDDRPSTTATAMPVDLNGFAQRNGPEHGNLRYFEVKDPSGSKQCSNNDIRDRQGHHLSRMQNCTFIFQKKQVAIDDRAAARRDIIP